MEYEQIVRTAMSVLRKNKPENIYIQGRNRMIDTYYDIWRGKPGWLNYSYRMPNGQKQSAKLKTLNMPRYICRTWANNYANEDTKITIPHESSNEALQSIFADTNLFGRFNNFCEMFMGLGIGATVVEVTALMDEETKELLPNPDGKVSITMIPGRRIVPITVEDGEVTECAFFTLVTGGAKCLVYYLNGDEYHLAIFQGNGNNGQYAWDWNNYTDIPTKAKKDTPLFQIWKPNLTEDDEIDASVGVSIFATAEDTFKQIDLGYTAYYKEVKLGQKVKFISSDVQKFDEDGNVELPFDEEDESVIFVPNANEAGSKMQEFNGELRIDAITKYINTNLNCAAMLCGLGQTQFEFDSGGGRPIQTATGVIAKQTELYRNVIKQENLALGCFRKLVMAIAHMNNEWTNQPKIEIAKKSDIVVTFDDNIMEDTTSKKEKELAEVNAGVMSVAEFRSHWYDEDYDSALKFLQESGMLVDKWTLALQAKVITPEMFVDFAFGENYKHKNELVAYITENLSQPQTPTGFEDESEEEEQEEDNEDTPKEDGKDDE